MPVSGDYILVHMLEPVSVEQRFARTRLAWPLHITLVPWFSIKDIEKLRSSLGRHARQTTAFTVRVGGYTELGVAGDIPVNMVEPQEFLRVWHNALTETVQMSGGVIENEQWTRDNYKAHITHHGDRRRQEGDMVQITDFYLVRLGPENMCEPDERFPLGKAS